MRVVLFLVLSAGLLGCQNRTPPLPSAKGDMGPPPPPPAERPKYYPLDQLVELPPAEREKVVAEHRYYSPQDEPSLAVYREAVVPLLVARFHSPNAEVRADVMSHLHMRIWPEIDPAGREAVLDQMVGRLPAERLPDAVSRESFFLDRVVTIEPLMTALVGAVADPHDSVRGNAVAALALLGPRAAGVVPRLVELTGGESGGARLAAAEALWWVGRHPAVGEALAAEVRAGDADRRRAAVALTVALTDGYDNRASFDGSAVAPHRRVCAEAAAEFPRLRFHDNGLTDAQRRDFILSPGKHLLVTDGEAAGLLTGGENALFRALLDAPGNAVERSRAGELLARAPAAVYAELDKDGGPAEAHRPTLAAAAAWLIRTRTDQPDRLRAMDAVAKIGPAAVDAVPALVDALGATDGRVRRRAAEVLGKLGPAAKAAIPALVKALKDDDLDARYAAGQALKAIDPETAKKALIP